MWKGPAYHRQAGGRDAARAAGRRERWARLLPRVALVLVALATLCFAGSALHVQLCSKGGCFSQASVAGADSLASTAGANGSVVPCATLKADGAAGSSAAAAAGDRIIPAEVILNRKDLKKQGMWWVPQHPRPSVCLSILCWKEKDSLASSMESWIKGGLLDYVDEVVLFFQELDEDKKTWLDPFKGSIRKPLRIIGSPRNEILLNAVNWAVGNCTSDQVLFLEKDWLLIEPQEKVKSQLDEGHLMLEHDVATIIHYRHRKTPGHPTYAMEMYRDRENVLVSERPDLSCWMYHWLSDEALAANWSSYIWRCPVVPRYNGDGRVIMDRNQQDWWCMRAAHCTWTNNPFLVKRSFWMAHYAVLIDELTATWDDWAEGQRYMDIEYLFNYNYAFWNGRAWTVARGDALFMHKEKGEHQEVDYKALRAEADAADAKKAEALKAREAESAKATAVLLAAEGGQASGAGDMTFLKANLPEWSIHTPPGTGFVAEGAAVLQQCALDDPAAPPVGESSPPLARVATTQGKQPEGGTGQGVRGNMTLVAVLLDLGRGDEANGPFKRGMDEYFQRFQLLLDQGFPMVVYMPREFCTSLKIDETRVAVVHTDLNELQTNPKYFGPFNARMQALRTSDLWQRQAASTGWLMKAPQAALPGYNVVVMSKLLLLEEAALWNPWGTPFHMMLDAGHLCARDMVPEQMPHFEDHMSRRFFASKWRYEPGPEVHGMTTKAMHIYVGNDSNPFLLIKGGVFGGRPNVISCAAKIYRMILKQTLQDGYMGTEENVLSILYNRFPQLFDEQDIDNPSPNNYCAPFQSNKERITNPNAPRVLHHRRLRRVQAAVRHRALLQLSP